MPISSLGRFSLQLVANPVGYWSVGQGRIRHIQNVELVYPGRGFKYELREKVGASVRFLEYVPKKKPNETYQVFDSTKPPLEGLKALAKLDPQNKKTLLQWIGERGLLGFLPVGEQTELLLYDHKFNPRWQAGANFWTGEPIDCIVASVAHARRALKLWNRLKTWYINPNEYKPPNDFIQLVESPILNYEKFKKLGLLISKVEFEVYVEKYQLTTWIDEKPICLKNWYLLVTDLLTTYINMHIEGEVSLTCQTQSHNVDWKDPCLIENFTPEYRPSPNWKVRSLLAAFYVQLLMVLREFRACQSCGKDISHQRLSSTYCGSSCRSKEWHREKAKQRTRKLVRQWSSNE